MKYPRIISDDLLIEIFKRIPGKSLSRFRCVSKHWNQLFRRPDFATIHFDYWKAIHSSSPGIVFSVSHSLKRIFFIVNEQGEAHHHLTIDTSKFGFRTHRTPLFVNGIFCLFDHYHVLVCNIATGEIISTPQSNLGRKYCYRAQYFFGFDPVHNEYKVLCVWMNHQESKTAESEVFTVGISKEWRNIDTLPSYIYNTQYLTTQSVCVNGNIYWVSDFHDGRKTGLISFDVREEKFRITAIRRGFGHPVQCEGDLAFVKGYDGSELLCEFDDDYDEYLIVRFEEGFEFPENPSHLVITSDLDRFFIFKRSENGELELSYYGGDGSIIRSSKITGLEKASYGWVWQPILKVAIHEHVENIHPLARI